MRLLAAEICPFVPQRRDRSHRAHLHPITAGFALEGVSQDADDENDPETAQAHDPLYPEKRDRPRAAQSGVGMIRERAVPYRDPSQIFEVPTYGWQRSHGLGRLKTVTLVSP